MKAATVVALGLLAACSGEGPTSAPVLESGGVVISSPVPFVGGIRHGGLAAPVGDSVVYVSLAPGTAATGVSASVRNVRSTATVTTPVYRGGFDPVALGARVGDSIEVVVTDASGAQVLLVCVAVAPLKPPVVIRTNPPPKKTDVPLNAIIMVVFSEPVAPSSITPATLQLFSGDQPVAGTVTLSPDGITADFQPATQLAPSTSYVFTISDQVAAVSGLLLGRALDVPFVTAATAPTVSAVSIAPDSATLLVGTRVQIHADGWEVPYGLVAAPPISWSSSDTTVARISPTGAVTAVATGVVIISAQWSQGTVTAALTVKTVTFASVSAGVFHTCGITTDNEAYCWGDNSHGELGTDLVPVGDSSRGPVIVAGNLKFATISVGDLFACGLTTDGTAYCWGDDQFGQLGIGPGWSTASPVLVSSDLKFTSISAGLLNACALTANGAAYCWGQNSHGTVGNGSTEEVEAVAEPVSGGLVFRSLSLGFVHACGVTTSGQVYCWGGLDYRQEPDFPTHSSVPILVATGPFGSLGGGMKHTCLVALDAAPYCWGKNNLGNLGNGSTTYAVAPTPVVGGLHVTTVTSGLGGQTCAIQTDGSLLCWGANAFGELGVDPTTQTCRDDNGQPASCSTTPVPGGGGLKFASVSAGQGYTCGLTLDGLAYCWGHNSPLITTGIVVQGGELGDGTTTTSWRPVRVLGQR